MICSKYMKTVLFTHLEHLDRQKQVQNHSRSGEALRTCCPKFEANRTCAERERERLRPSPLLLKEHVKRIQKEVVSSHKIMRRGPRRITATERWIQADGPWLLCWLRRARRICLASSPPWKVGVPFQVENGGRTERTDRSRVVHQSQDETG